MAGVIEVAKDNVAFKREAKKALFASFIGSVIEWYDYLVYGTLAALVLNQLFFPNFDPVIGLLLSYVSFSLTFLLRPVGGVIFSHFGDKIGRKHALIYTLVLMGVATFLIGVLPDYNTIGIWAPILLLIFRCVQGLGIGGEWGGAVILAVEYSEDHNRGFYGSIPQLGVPCGLLLGTLTFSLLTAMPHAEFLAWGWRIPFFFSAVLILIGLWIRSRLEETPVFQKVKEKQEIAKVPLFETLHHHWKMVLVCIGLVAGTTTPFYIFSNFSIAYTTKYLNFNDSTILNAITIATAITIITIPLIGKLSDKLGRKAVFFTGLFVTIFFVFLYFFLLSKESAALLFLVTIIGFIIWSLGWSVQGTMYTEMFTTEVRYTGMTFGYQIGAALAGGTAPIIAIYLLSAFNNSWIPVAIYMGITCVISIVALYFVHIRKVKL